MAIKVTQQRPASFVKLDFAEKGVTVGLLSRWRLAHFPSNAYGQVLSLVSKVSGNVMIDRVKIDPFEKVSSVNFTDIPVNIIEKQCIKGKRANLLDLRGIEVSLSRANAERFEEQIFSRPEEGKIDLRVLYHTIAGEQNIFERIMGSPDLSTDKVFRALDHAVENKVFPFEMKVFRGKSAGAQEANAISFNLRVKGGTIGHVIIRLPSATDERSAIDVGNAMKLYFSEVSHTLEKAAEKEIRSIGLQAVEERSRDEKVHKPFSETQYYGGSRMYRSGAFTTEYNDDPARNYSRIEDLVIDNDNAVAQDCLGVKLPRKEMKEHGQLVKHRFTDRAGTEVTGFATADEHSDYISSRQKIGKLVYYAGIMVKKQYRGGRTAFLTFLMMLKIFKGLGFINIFFGKTPITFRTQDKRISRMGRRYFGVKYDPSKFTPEDWNAVRFTAEKYGWDLEPGTNICRNCYNVMMTDGKKSLLPELGPTDGSVNVGYVTWKSLYRLIQDIFIFKKSNFNGASMISLIT